MNDFPVLATERLELRVPQMADEAVMFAIISDPRTNAHLGPASQRHEHFTRFQRNAGSWLLNGYGGFMVRRRGEAEVIGNCGIFHSHRGLGEDFDDKAEAGWIVSADHVGQGIAGEAMAAVFAWFDRTHGPREVVCMIEPENAPSVALARKLGFEPMRLATLPNGDEVQLFARAARGGPG